MPPAYVMQPVEVTLVYQGGQWCTVKFELGRNEIGDAEQPDYQLADDLAELFTDVGLEPPKPVRVMRADHQIAQKLRGLRGRQRTGPLVDLQLLDKGEGLDVTQVRATCVRLFEY